MFDKFSSTAGCNCTEQELEFSTTESPHRLNTLGYVHPHLSHTMRHITLLHQFHQRKPFRTKKWKLTWENASPKKRSVNGLSDPILLVHVYRNVSYILSKTCRENHCFDHD